MTWKCECGEPNTICEEYCHNCGKDKNGRTAKENTEIARSNWEIKNKKGE
jgi:hypothetical protein